MFLLLQRTVYTYLQKLVVNKDKDQSFLYVISGKS